MDRYFSTLLFVLCGIASILFSICFCCQLFIGYLNLFMGLMMAVIGTLIWKMTICAYKEMRKSYKGIDNANLKNTGTLSENKTHQT